MAVVCTELILVVPKFDGMTEKFILSRKLNSIQNMYRLNGKYVILETVVFIVFGLTNPGCARVKPKYYS